MLKILLVELGGYTIWNKFNEWCLCCQGIENSGSRGQKKKKFNFITMFPPMETENV